MPKPPKGKTLTKKEELFVQEYLIDFNGTQAAIRAGYSARSAANTASENIRKPHIKIRIDEAYRELRERTQVTLDQIVKELQTIATFNVAVFFDDKGKLKDLSELPHDLKTVIADLEVQKMGDFQVTKKIKFYNKLDALEKLMKHLGGYREDNRQKNPAETLLNKLPTDTLKELLTYVPDGPE